MAMSFVPQMQNYFGKDTDFTKLSDAYGDSDALGVQADIKGDVLRADAKMRAKQRLMQGKYQLSQGRQAGSAATTSGIISGVGSVVGGYLQSDMFSGRPGMDTPIKGVDDDPFNLGGGIKGVSGGSPVDSTFGIPVTLPGSGGGSLA